MCVNLGIKPRVHYHSGYPCQDIADLFESEVNMGFRWHVDAPVHCELPANTARGIDEDSASLVEGAVAPGRSHAGHAGAVAPSDQLSGSRHPLLTYSRWQRTCWRSEMAVR